MEEHVNEKFFLARLKRNENMCFCLYMNIYSVKNKELLYNTISNKCKNTFGLILPKKSSFKLIDEIISSLLQTKKKIKHNDDR